MIILNVLFYIVMLLLILLAAALLIPFRYFFLGKKYTSASVKLSISWLFGLIRLSYKKAFSNKGVLILSVFGLKFNIRMQERTNKHKKEPKEKEHENNLRFFDKYFIRTITKAIVELFRHIKPRHFYLEGRFGFEDPYYTGITSGVLNIFCSELQGYRINARAVFDEEVLEGKLFLSGRVILIKVVYLALKLYLNKRVRNVLKSKKEEKAYVI